MSCKTCIAVKGGTGHFSNNEAYRSLQMGLDDLIHKLQVLKNKYNLDNSYEVDLTINTYNQNKLVEVVTSKLTDVDFDSTTGELEIYADVQLT